MQNVFFRVSSKMSCDSDITRSASTWRWNGYALDSWPKPRNSLSLQKLSNFCYVLFQMREINSMNTNREMPWPKTCATHCHAYT